MGDAGVAGEMRAPRRRWRHLVRALHRQARERWALADACGHADEQVAGSVCAGTVFDETFKKGIPHQTMLGNGHAIRGWDEGLQGMCVGEQRKLYVPAALAYGEAGQPDKVPPNEDLEYVVELVAIGEMTVRASRRACDRAAMRRPTVLADSDSALLSPMDRASAARRCATAAFTSSSSFTTNGSPCFRSSATRRSQPTAARESRPVGPRRRTPHGVSGSCLPLGDKMRPCDVSGCPWRTLQGDRSMPAITYDQDIDDAVQVSPCEPELEHKLRSRIVLSITSIAASASHGSGACKPPPETGEARARLLRSSARVLGLSTSAWRRSSVKHAPIFGGSTRSVRWSRPALPVAALPFGSSGQRSGYAQL